MIGFDRGAGLAAAIVALGLAWPAAAQENLDSGKTGAQLFASDCAICHKSAQGLAKAGGVFGLADYLRAHYTASRQSAATIAAYVESVDKTRGASKRPPTPVKRTAKTGKPADAKPGETLPADAKPAAEAKPAGDKPGEMKPVPAAKPDKPEKSD